MNSDDIQGVIRHILTTAGGALVTTGVLSSGQLQDAIGALMVIGGIGWSLYQKSKQRKALAVAQSPITPRTISK